MAFWVMHHPPSGASAAFSVREVLPVILWYGAEQKVLGKVLQLVVRVLRKKLDTNCFLVTGRACMGIGTVLFH